MNASLVSSTIAALLKALGASSRTALSGQLGFQVHPILFREIHHGTQSLHFDEVNHAFEFTFSTNWTLNRNRFAPSFSLMEITRRQRSLHHSVHFIDKRNTRNMVLVGLAPDCFRLWFNTRYGIKDSYSTI